MLIKVIFHTLCFSLAISLAAVAAENKQVIDIAYLTQETVAPPQLSNIDPFIKNKGVFGAELAIADNNTTGQFTHQQFRLKAFTVPVDGNVEEVFGKQIAGKYRYVVTVLPPAPLLKIADSPAAKALLLLDAATIDDSLRNGQCRANVLHLLPSRSMRADALAQYMTKKTLGKMVFGGRHYRTGHALCRSLKTRRQTL